MGLCVCYGCCLCCTQEVSSWEKGMVLLCWGWDRCVGLWENDGRGDVPWGPGGESPVSALLLQGCPSTCHLLRCVLSLGALLWMESFPREQCNATGVLAHPSYCHNASAGQPCKPLTGAGEVLLCFKALSELPKPKGRLRHKFQLGREVGKWDI